MCPVFRTFKMPEQSQLGEGSFSAHSKLRNRSILLISELSDLMTVRVQLGLR